MPLCKASWVPPTERHVPFDEVQVVMWIKGEQGEEEIPPPNKVIEDLAAADVDAEDGWDTFNISHSGEIDVQSSLQ